MTYPQHPHHQHPQYAPVPQHGPYGQPGPYGYQAMPYGHPTAPRGRSGMFWLFIVGLPLVVLASCTAAVALIGTPYTPQPVAQDPPAVADRMQPPATGDAQPLSPPSTEPAAKESQPVAAPPQTAGIGSEVRDGLFAFTVTRVERTGQVGGEVLHKTAQGEFLVVHIVVKNIGDKAGHFFGNNQKVFDGQGREFSADSGAALYMPESKSLYEQLNPGSQVNGTVLFDLPKGVKAAAIELHDSMFSGGVRVELGGQ